MENLLLQLKEDLASIVEQTALEAKQAEVDSREEMKNV